MTPAWSSTRIGRLRIKALAIIENFEAQPQAVAPASVMDLIALQDQITRLKQRNLAFTAKTSDFAWVDTWAPR